VDGSLERAPNDRAAGQHGLLHLGSGAVAGATLERPSRSLGAVAKVGPPFFGRSWQVDHRCSKAPGIAYAFRGPLHGPLAFVALLWPSDRFARRSLPFSASGSHVPCQAWWIWTASRSAVGRSRSRATTATRRASRSPRSPDGSVAHQPRSRRTCMTRLRLTKDPGAHDRPG